MGEEFLFLLVTKEELWGFLVFFFILGLYICCLLDVSRVIFLSQHSKLTSKFP